LRHALRAQALANALTSEALGGHRSLHSVTSWSACGLADEPVDGVKL